MSDFIIYFKDMKLNIWFSFTCFKQLIQIKDLSLKLDEMLLFSAVFPPHLLMQGPDAPPDPLETACPLRTAVGWLDTMPPSFPSMPELSLPVPQVFLYLPSCSIDVTLKEKRFLLLSFTPERTYDNSLNFNKCKEKPPQKYY